MFDSFLTSRTVACQAPLSVGFSRQEYWSGLPFPLPGDLPDPGIEPAAPVEHGMLNMNWTWQACSLPAKWSEKPIKLLIHLNHCQSISRMPKVYSTLMGLLCYFSVLSHQELFTQVFKNVNIWNFNSDLNSVETTLSWRIDRKLWTRRSGCRGIKLPTGTVRR